MMKKSNLRIILLAAALISASAFTFCTRESDKVAPVPQGPGAPLGQAAGGIAGGTQGAEAEMAGSGRVRGVTAGSYSGAVDLSTVTSDSPCRSASDCTSTKFANAPKSKTQCTCQAACEPFVVNMATKTAREEANKICGNSDWFGPNCPAPNCNFIEYERFDCVKGKCQGTDMDGE